MSWTLLTAACGMALVVALAAAAALRILVRRNGAVRRGNRVSGRAAPAVAGGSGASLFGLAPQDAAKFRQSARSDMEREQLQWDRDYLPSVSDGAMPGRIAGIPRTLRVKR